MKSESDIFDSFDKAGVRFAEFPLNGVKHISFNSRKISFRNIFRE